MAKTLNVKKIIADNPAIDEKNFHKAHDAVKKLNRMGFKSAEYDLLPPFTTRRQIRILDETDDELRSVHVRY